MKTLQKCFNLLLVVALGLTCMASATPSTQTLNNLQAAFNGESNAHAKYLAYAKRADENGFGGIVAIIGCYKGMYCGEGAEGVGRATTEAVVYSSITILITNFFLTLFLGELLHTF